jgi:hypothetical protein
LLAPAVTNAEGVFWLAALVEEFWFVSYSISKQPPFVIRLILARLILGMASIIFLVINSLSYSRLFVLLKDLN